MTRSGKIGIIFLMTLLIAALSACVKREHSNPLDPDYEIPGSGPSSPPLYLPVNLSEIRTPRPFFDWADIERVDSYEIFITDTTNLTVIQDKNVTVSYYRAGISLPDKKYFWKVRSRDGAGSWGGWSATWSFIVDTRGPTPPIALGPVSESITSDNTPRLDWESIDDAVLYEISVMSYLDSVVVTDTSLVNSEYILQTPVPDGVYFWTVRCRDKAGNWGDSTPVTSLYIRTGTHQPPTIQWASVSGGTFQMGSNASGSNASPAHSVTLSAFQISKLEINNAQFARFLNEYGSPTVKSGPDAGKTMFNENSRGAQSLAGFWHVDSNYVYYPALDITWYGANEFCRYYQYRLPTEAEWEYAARDGHFNSSYIYSGSNNINSVAWYRDNSNNRTHPVGSKSPNLLGIFDMSGNVEEWCQDWYGSYTSDPQTNPAGPSTGTYRILRGGAYYSQPIQCENSRRSNALPGNSSDYGFRCVKN